MGEPIEPAEERTQAQLRHGLRIAILLVTVAIVFGLGLTNLARGWHRYDVPLAQVAAFATLAAVLGVEAVLLARRLPWHTGPRRLAIAAVLAASVLSYATLPEGRTSTATDWIFGAANWAGLVLLLNRPLWTMVTFLVTHELLALLNVFLLHEPSRGALLRFTTGSVNVFGFPLCVAVVAAVLNRIGRNAAVATRELERLRTAEAVAAESHRRRGLRFAELTGTTVPLLEGLADGTLVPTDSEVQRRCAIEAARMRRLFAEADRAPDPLLHELRHCADVADRKGVQVELEARGRWPVPPVAVRRDLTDAALTALATAGSWARVTVVGAPDMVSVSVVADCSGIDLPSPATPDVRLEKFSNENAVWLEARWQPTG
ncbi:AbrB family transcriptional regulator [Amycolatopsis aidingensis]|uniref:AbrB family transcriptional regulator n=1 Tax=Amycolatopsis aidingensis TaxID=2842453 RepID=UPI001C0DEF4A|nr:AbrB family transcriptional regulator [Amycolatopsis aidingensis]